MIHNIYSQVISMAAGEDTKHEIISVFEQFIGQYFGKTTTSFLAGLSLMIIVILISLIAYLLTKHIVLRILTHYIENNRYDWDAYLLKHKVLHRLSHLLPVLIIYNSAPLFGSLQAIIERLGSIYLIVLIVSVINALLNAIDDIYNRHEVARQKPIKGYLQGLKIFIFVIAGIVILSRLLGQSPLILLSGIGAMTAVIMLIFQDSILGLVAGIQLAANDMVRIGDWIEMPKYNADGDVIEITLTTVKVENFDKTITTVPPHALVKDSFRNWRGMQETGGRRIMRSIYIDTSSICFCTDEMINSFMEIDILKEYVSSKQSEIENYNTTHKINNSTPVNGRHMTNVGTFRAYIIEYIRSHTRIRQDMIQMVRQLPPKEYGLPIELYMFTKTTDWSEYETIQADIFDHILAVAPLFGLRLFQNPSGYDLRQLTEN
ncbi:MAG: mechanosensitive ion channel [Eubacteriales bacterium]|nr:mechanosensitive ion channel [Eubacteriales bacterium]MDD3197072.1 mechanosensitive ion channel [Eubacteriales bacterium]MDD4683595.1 mechanosensitive ion channel [Eubacteriales bacterium]